jgi:hypothetical protein
LRLRWYFHVVVMLFAYRSHALCRLRVSTLLVERG